MLPSWLLAYDRPWRDGFLKSLLKLLREFVDLSINTIQLTAR
jgi:hypothetical protein